MPVALSARVERWPFAKPFRITGYEWTETEILVVEARAGERCGRGEGLGVYYHDDTPEKGRAQIDALSARVAAGEPLGELLAAMPAGGARNALDCALWDLRAKLDGVPVWQLLELGEPKPILTTFTVGADEPARMADTARGYAKARALKLKLTGTREDASRVRAVREARPGVWLGVDGNRGFSRASLESLMPALVECDVSLVEQPFPIGWETEGRFASPIPIAADESAQDTSSLSALEGCVDVVNVKLDKCGGLTEGMKMVRELRRLDIRPMVGCMGGTSLSMAPAFLLGQLCDVVDLDGPILFSRDREPSAVYDGEGRIYCSDAVWGGAD